jgi:hypothetical protein
MPVDVNIGIDNAYNVPRRARLHELERMGVITHNPQLLGGGPVRMYALSGNTGAYPLDEERLEAMKQMGGASVGKIRQLKPKKMAPAVQRLDLEGGVNRYKKAKKWTGFAVDTANKGLDLAAKAAMTGGVNRYKKAKKWTGFAVDTANKGLDLAAKAAMTGGVNRYKKAKKWTGFAVDTANKGLDLAAKGSMMGFGELKAKRPPGVRAQIVKKVMEEQGLKMIEASKYVKAHGLYQKQ